MNQTFELFLHGRGAPMVILASPDETLSALLGRLDALPGEHQFVFVGEAIELRPDHLDEDAHHPACLDHTVTQAGLGRHGHLHTRAPHRIGVTVNFNGEQRKHRFSPHTTIAAVTAWAKARFKVDSTTGAGLVLAVNPGGLVPRPEQHLGDVVPHGNCEIAFDLVREVNPQG